MVSIRFDNVTGKMIINGVPVLQTDVAGNFGILHGIDGVLAFDGQYNPCDPYTEIGFLTLVYEQEITEAAIEAQAFTASKCSEDILSFFLDMKHLTN